MRIKIGDKIVEVDRVENGLPVIRATGEEIPNADGGTDVVVHVPCLRLGTSLSDIEETLKQRLTDDFLQTLLMAAESFGWSDEILEFVKTAFVKADKDVSDIPDCLDGG